MIHATAIPRPRHAAARARTPWALLGALAASLLVTAVLALTTETREVQWSGQFVFALLWVALVLSIGAISLLNHLIRSGTAVNVTRLFYTVPAVTALMAWAIFGETLTGLSLIGMGVAVLGVWLARGR